MTIFLWFSWILIFFLMAYALDMRDKFNWQKNQLNYLKGLTDDLLKPSKNRNINKDLQFRITELEETLVELHKRYARTVNIDDFAHKVNSRKPIFKYNDWEKELLVLVKDKVRDMDKPMEKFLIEELKEHK